MVITAVYIDRMVNTGHLLSEILPIHGINVLFCLLDIRFKGSAEEILVVFIASGPMMARR